MSLLRFVARSLFASYFVAEGVKAVTKPAEIAPDIERFAGTVSPLLQRALPADLAGYVPVKPEAWARINGAAQVVGGVMFATGLGRRAGALLLAGASAVELTGALPAKDAPEAIKESARPQALRAAGLLGASLLAALDTQGRPSLAWRADHAVKSTEKKAEELGENITRSARKAAARTEKKARRLGKDARKQAKAFGRKLEAVTAS